MDFAITRHKQEEKAMAIIYQCLCYDDMKIPYDIKDMISNNLDSSFDDADLFIKQIVVSSMAHKEEIINAISANLIKWSYQRLEYLTKAILFLAYVLYYYNYSNKVDKKVAINVAVKLAKKYTNGDTYKLINGVLDKILL